MAPFRGQGNNRGGRGDRGGGRGGRGGFRGGRGAYGGPKLPAELREQVDSAYGSGGRRGDYTRKEKRKFERDEKRSSHQTQGRSRHAAASLSDNEYDDDEDGNAPPPPKKVRASTSSKADAESEKQQKKEKKKKLPELRLPGEVEGDAEDQEIEWLEWMLKKEKGKGKEVDDDGLSDILDFADDIGPGGKGLKGADKGLASDEDEDDIFDLDGTVDGDSDVQDEEDAESEVSENHDDDDDDDDDEMDAEVWGGIKSDGGDSASEDGKDDSDGEEQEIDLNSEASETDSPKWTDRQGTGESSNGGDSYKASDSTTINGTSLSNESGLISTADAPAPTKYVPPHLRAAQLEEKARGSKEKVEERIRLERKAQGLLNKLSEANLESILGEVEGLYRGHSRNDVSTTLTNLVIQMISSKTNLLDSFVVLYATMVGALHRVIGMEFGAHFVHTLIMRYHTLTTDPNAESTTKLEANIYETPDASKEALNLLTLVAELYNAQVIGSKLIYDLIKGFLEAGDEKEIMGERAVEGLLKILRCSGAQLRTDDPASLKDIVNLVQEKTKGKEKTMTARARFLVETLTNVKNGKIKATSGSGAEAGNDAAARMKKFLSGLGRKRRLLAYEPLRVSLSDLLSADKKGKWWLVGAGWSGNPLVEHGQQQQQQTGTSSSAAASTIDMNGKKTTSSSKSKKADGLDVNDEEALLDLARKQGMNTDVRRGVFVVLMTSEDYVHACDRLSLFKLTEVQQREFVRVALHCCGLEKTYNPYYTLILSHLCANSYDHRFTLQYALWDFMRELDESGAASSKSKSKSSRQKLVNVAKAVAYIVARGGLDLTVFKALDFTSLSSPLITFLTTFLIHMLISLHTASPVFTLPKTFTISSGSAAVAVSSDDDFDEESVQEKFEKTLSNTELAGGWLYVIDRGMKIPQIEKMGANLGFKQGGKELEVVKRGVEVGKRVLGNAI
ncbi:hypothetical protein IAU59_004575 [Kwoniella sp. CBS 9459]